MAQLFFKKELRSKRPVFSIYLTSLDDGAITVLKAGTATPQVAANNPSLGERVAATPAIADDTLYVRTAGHLYAFAAKK